MRDAIDLLTSLPQDLPEDLQFLKPYLKGSPYRYREPSFLTQGDYNSEVWHVDALHKFEIDWRVPIGASGTLLTDIQHRQLWHLFRSWLVVQSHPDISLPGSSKRAIYNRLRAVGMFIDYFVLNADRLGISNGGFGVVSKNDMAAAIALAQRGPASTFIFGWQERLTSYLRGEIFRTERTALEKELDAKPQLLAPLSTARLTSLSDPEVFLARALICSRGWLISRRGGLHLDTQRLQEAVFQNRLTQRRSMPVPPEFQIAVSRDPRREHASVPVHRSPQADGRRGMSITMFCAVARTLDLLRQDDLAIPELPDLSKRIWCTAVPGRFRTVPPQLVLDAVQTAITYVLERGTTLVDSYLVVAARAKALGIGIPALDRREGIVGLLPQAAIDLGVSRWAVAYDCVSGEGSRGGDEHQALRAGSGLYESLRVLYGACLVVVGALSARRNGELADLVAGSALDELRTGLKIVNRKSGHGRFRETIRIPIPHIAVRCVELLESVQNGLLALNILSRPQNLFCFPKKQGTPGLVAAHHDESLDYFCDWAELSLDPDGRRHYLRQHQLRRFFAMLFFWGNGFGSLDVLREFLGHTNAQHIYNYVTESTPGAVLKDIETQYVTSALSNDVAPDALRSLIFNHFGTHDFHAVRAADLERYVSELVSAGTVKVTPVFLDRGKRYKILVVVNEDLT